MLINEQDILLSQEPAAYTLEDAQKVFDMFDSRSLAFDYDDLNEIKLSIEDDFCYERIPVNCPAWMELFKNFEVLLEQKEDFDNSLCIEKVA